MAARLPAGGAAGTPRAGGQDSAFTAGYSGGSPQPEMLVSPQLPVYLLPTYRLKQPTDQKPLDATRTVNSEPANSPHDQKKPSPEKSGPSTPCLAAGPWASSSTPKKSGAPGASVPAQPPLQADTLATETPAPEA